MIAEVAERFVAEGLQPVLDVANEEAWASVVLRYEQLSARLSHLSSYVGCLSAADAKDERYSLAESRLNLLRASFDKIEIELRRAFGSATEETFGRFVTRRAVQHAAYPLRRLRIEAATRMDPAREVNINDR